MERTAKNIAAKSQQGQEIPELTEDQARKPIALLFWTGGKPVCRH